MFPVYRDMNSNPLRNQAPPPQSYPMWGSPPQVTENQTNIPQMHECWPHNYPYPSPAPCQNCCTHGQAPSYRPQWPHFPPPPPYAYYYGGYPAAYPPPYPYVPPPQYSVEMPRYEYDKSSPNAFHCCECPNHPSHVKSTNNVKIEEHDPDVETKKSESLVPAGVGNSPYPTLWFPPEYVLNREQPRRVVKSDAGEQPNQSIQAIGKDQNGRYQWFPLDMNSIKKLMEGGDMMKPRDKEKKGVEEKKLMDSAQKDQSKPFSYPIVWMPYDMEGEGHLKGQRNIGKIPAGEQEQRNNEKQAIEQRPTVKILKHPDDNELVKERPTAGEKSIEAGIRGSNKPANVRTIPVKQLDDSVPMPSKKEEGNTAKASFKDAGAVAKNGTDMKPLSLTKKSKLPPICLRVDPPKKKNGKGSSRSPSPPGRKKRPESGNASEDRKVEQLKNGKEDIQIENEQYGMKEKDKAQSVQERQPESEKNAMQDTGISKSGVTICGKDGLLHSPEVQGKKDDEDEKTSEVVKKILSETEAAVIIQSAYRGYVVRRWEPLKKLRQIAVVREEATKVKSQIEKLGSCGAMDNKEKIAIGETIMNLLLRLDTIQGLHPSVRDVRKSVANELVLWQEKLDSIRSPKSMLTDQYKSISHGVEEHLPALNSDADPVGSLENVTDTSTIIEQGEAAAAKKTVETQKKTEEASSSKDPLSSSITSLDTLCNAGSEVLLETSEGSGRWHEVVPPKEVSSDYGGSALCLDELDKPVTAPDSSSLDSQGPLAEERPLEDTFAHFNMASCEEDQEANRGAASSEETVGEKVENDLCRMDWECDSAAAKITQDINIEETVEGKVESDLCRMDWECDLGAAKISPDVDIEAEIVEENDVQADSFGGASKEDQGATTELDDSGTWKKVLEMDRPTENLEAQCEAHVAAETCDENNLSARKCDIKATPKSVDVPIFEKGDLLKECTAEEAPLPGPVTEVEMEVIKESQQTEVDGEPKELENESLSNQQTVSGDLITVVDEQTKCVYAPVFEVGDWPNERTAQEVPSPVHDVEVEKEVIKEGHEPEVDGQLKEAANESLSNLQTVSGDQITELPISGDLNESKSSTYLTDAPPHHEDVPKQPALSSEVSAMATVSGNGEQIDRKMMEENDKLRNMVEKLLASGKEQQDVISNLSAKVKDLEKKISKRSRMRSGKRPGVIISRGKPLSAR